jgi:N-acetylglucosamine-6-phosphate deacetylase
MKTVESVYGSLDNVKMITVAPEVPGIMEIISELKARSIIVSAGHSEATFALAEAAIARGVSMITHLFNAMQPVRFKRCTHVRARLC